MAYLTPTYYVVQPVRTLPPAPYGSRWVRVDNQYYLVQTRTGLIAQTVAARRLPACPLPPWPKATRSRSA